MMYYQLFNKILKSPSLSKQDKKNQNSRLIMGNSFSLYGGGFSLNDSSMIISPKQVLI